MSSFEVKIERLSGNILEENTYGNCIGQLEETVAGTQGHIGYMGARASEIFKRIKDASSMLGVEKSNFQELSNALNEVIATYLRTENLLLGNSDTQGGKESIASRLPVDENGEVIIEDIPPSKWEEILDYIGDSVWQALIGDFYTGDDATLLGVVLSIGIGFIPYVGQAADVRDLVADICHLIDDGPTTEEWVALGFTLVGIIPGLGDAFKHGDDVADFVKRTDIFKHADEAIEMVKKSDAYKYVDEAADVAKKYVAKAGDLVNSKADEVIKSAQNAVGKAVKNVDEFVTNHNVTKKVKEFAEKPVQKLDEILSKNIVIPEYEIGDIFKFKEESVNGYRFAKEIADDYISGFEQTLLTMGIDTVLGTEQK